jgi:SAM-dependent methyltransferase
MHAIRDDDTLGAMGYGSGLPGWVPTLTYQPSPPVRRVMAAYGQPPALVVDLGAGGRRIAPHIKTVDFSPHPDVDFQADVCNTPFPNGSVDLVLATGLLEHVEDERRLLAEIWRILKPGGVAHIELPFLQQYHDDPIDSRRYTQPGLARLMIQHGFQPLETGTHIGPTVTILTLVSYFAALLFEGRSLPAKLLSNGSFVLIHALGWPAKFLDRWLISKPSAHRLAFGVYCTARKPVE